MTNYLAKRVRRLGACLILLSPAWAFAFESGSNGADGAFNPLVDTEVQLPPDGIFNYTSVTIPAGVTVTFAKNDTNTPVVWLASGDVTIEGTIDIRGTNAANTGTSGDGNVGDDGLPGEGGPGGFDGGAGGRVGDATQGDNILGSSGRGPGAGDGSNVQGSLQGCGGSGGGFAEAGDAPNVRFTVCNGNLTTAGPAYGTAGLLPLIGGSGGGGGSAGGNFGGSGGGGGGGAILIAVSGTLAINGGSILAQGGNGGGSNGSLEGGTGGGGSGGAIRLVATTLTGSGALSADNGIPGANLNNSAQNGGSGGDGRIRLEAETFTFTSGTTPTFAFADPGNVFVAGLPSLLITSVAGAPAPAEPTGEADIILPEDTPNPVTVEFATTNVPVGNTVTLSVTPASADAINTISTALSGTDAAASATATTDLPLGPSTLLATVSFTVTAAQGAPLMGFTDGEQVERVELAAAPGKGSQTTLITVSGKAYTLPSNAIAMAGSH